MNEAIKSTTALLKWLYKLYEVYDVAELSFTEQEMLSFYHNGVFISYKCPELQCIPGKQTILWWKKGSISNSVILFCIDYDSISR